MTMDYDLLRSAEGDWMLLVELPPERVARAAPGVAALSARDDALVVFRHATPLTLSPLTPQDRAALEAAAPASVIVTEICQGEAVTFYLVHLTAGAGAGLCP
jgi:hypothetical protein